MLCLANILHQHRITQLCKGLRNIGTLRVQQALRLVLVLNPGSYLSSAALLRFACRSAPTSAIAMLGLTLFIALYPTVTVDRIIAQTPKHAGTIDLGR